MLSNAEDFTDSTFPMFVAVIVLIVYMYIFFLMLSFFYIPYTTWNYCHPQRLILVVGYCLLYYIHLSLVDRSWP